MPFLHEWKKWFLEHIEGLFSMIPPIGVAFFIRIWGKKTSPVSIAVISILILIVGYGFVIAIVVWLKRKWEDKWKVSNIQIIIGALSISVILMSIFIFLDRKEINGLQSDINEQQTQIASKSTEMQATIDYQSTQLAPFVNPTPTLTSAINSFEDLPICNFEEQNFPCIY